jgi:transglutaminase superfamily protein
MALLWSSGAFAVPITDSDDWTGTYYKGSKIGFNHARVEVRPDSIEVHTKMYFRLKSGKDDQSTILTQDTTLTPDLRLQRFVLLQEIMGKRQEVVGRVEGTQLHLEISGRGFHKKQTIDFPLGVHPSATVWLNIVKDGFEVGKKGKYNLFLESFRMVIPMTYEILRKETIQFDGKSVDTFVVQQKFAGMTTTLWANAEGDMLRELSLNDFESIREPKEVATRMDDKPMSVSSFITLSLVKIQRPIPSPDNKGRLKLKLSNVHGPESIPQDHRQKVLKTTKMGEESYTTTLLIEREPKAPAKRVSLPVPTSRYKDYLKDAPEIQVQHPMIRALARDLVKGQDDAWQAAKLISSWVYDNLDKVLVDSFTALDALHDRRGECQSHTNLFTALARAAGIPTKVVNGLVYSREFKGFLYHAWPEVWVGEWRALDPTLGQHRVDATHIKLSEGNYAGALKLMEFIGQVKIELLEQ